MKILLYTYDIMKIGGIETSFYNLSQFLSGMGHEVGVRYSIAAPMQIERYKNAGIDIRPVKEEICDVLLIGSVWKQPSLITANLTVQQVHADWSDKFWKGAGSALKMLHKADNNVDMYACVSESAASFVRKVTKKDVVVMNNIAPEPKKIIRYKKDKVVFAAFTRMTSEKGLENYQSLRKRVEELGIDAEFRVYTNGEAPEGWTLFEPIPDIREVFHDIDFVCSMADTESFGYTIAEANSCGVPCIIKKCNSTLEFFDEKQNIILDDVNSLTIQTMHSITSSKYNLHTTTRENVKEATELFDTLQKTKCIIKSIRVFYDIEAGKKRLLGQKFSVTKKRAKQLLSNDIKIVEQL